MTVAQAPHTLNNHRYEFLVIVKSFLIWTFALTVGWLVVGFPVVAIMATLGALAAVVLQAVFPMGAVLLAAGTILILNVLGILVGSAFLAMKGIHPHNVRWLRWLDTRSDKNSPVYAACPLTCDRLG
jgi:hypothetical protein